MIGDTQDNPPVAARIAAQAWAMRPHFQNNVRRGHHWCFVAINGGTLELKACNLEDATSMFSRL
ncbi:MAG: hypothetical protein ABGY71_05295 [bacterium]|jgi:hypothetical protein|nr:hypothetical protein [Planctomycetota bacterium]